MMIPELRDRIFNIQNSTEFEELAIQIFRYQAAGNHVYREYLSYLRKKPELISDVHDIPFLPINFFRRHKVVTGNRKSDIIFSSSGTTGAHTSRHYIASRKTYEESFLRCFRLFYSEPADYTILALLPSYLERGGSSLVYMMQRLIALSGNPHSGFYLRNYDELLNKIELIREQKGKILLLGVSYALLELAEHYSPDLESVTVIETGGMKGMRREMIREELHAVLTRKLHVPEIHSEYGMTELLSQSYSTHNGLFRTPPWMSVIIRDPNDPLTNFKSCPVSGGINIIDLANIDSCCFIATDDLGKKYADGTFEVSGRFDSSDIRGCNLLI